MKISTTFDGINQDTIHIFYGYVGSPGAYFITHEFIPKDKFLPDLPGNSAWPEVDNQIGSSLDLGEAEFFALTGKRGKLE